MMGTRSTLCLAIACSMAGAAGSGAERQPVAVFTTGPASMAVVAVSVTDACRAASSQRVTALGVYLDDQYAHELLLFPGAGPARYETLLGPLGPGRHEVGLRPSALWEPSACLHAARVEVSAVGPADPRYAVLAHAPVLEIRADTVGGQTDVPLYEYVEDGRAGLARQLRYTVVFSNEDGGTPTRALLARWGRTTDIEQIYEAWLQDGRAVREEYQGPDHEIRAFAGRRRGAAPVLLVATLNNMVTDRGRGIAPVRPVPEVADLSRATRESTLDSRPWAYAVMARELAAEGHVSSDAPAGDGWMRQAPDPREHVYLEARLTLDHAAAAAWVQDRDGRRSWSHYERDGLAIDRPGWVRTAVAIGTDAGSRVAAMGWACLSVPKQGPAGSCVIEATRAFVFADGWRPGPNLVAPSTFELRTGEEATLAAARD